MASEHEDLLNGELARLLREHDVPADPEVRERGRRMDVAADVEGVRVVLEAETGDPGRRSQAVREADAPGSSPPRPPTRGRSAPSGSIVREGGTRGASCRRRSLLTQRQQRGSSPVNNLLGTHT